MWNLDTESIQELLFGQGFGDGAPLGLGLGPSSHLGTSLLGTSLLGTFLLGTSLLHVACCDLHFGSIRLDHGDGAIAVGVELGNLLGLLELAHLVEQGRPPRSEGKVHEQIAHVLACAILDCSNHLLESRARLEVPKPEDDHASGRVVARDNLRLGDSHAQLPEQKLPHILWG